MPKKDLTDTFIRQATYTGDKPYIDYTQNGLIFRVSRTGVKSFHHQYRINQKKRLMTIGRYPDVSLKQARDAVIQAKANLRSGIDPQQSRDDSKKETIKADVLTVEDALDRFINRHAKHNLTEQVWKQYQSGYRKLPTKILKTNIHDLKAISISDYVEGLHKTPIKALNMLRDLKSAFSWLHGKGYIKNNVVKDIQKPFKEKQRERVLSGGELKAVINACYEMGYPAGDATLIMIYTGQRKNEVAKMAWGELDLGQGVWTIPAERSKNNKEQIVPLSAVVLDILNNIHRQKGDYVFSNTDGYRPITHGGKVKARLNTLVGFEDWTIHDIRRTTATNLAKLEVSDAVIATVLNHSKGRLQGVTSVYNRHDYLDQTQRALNMYSDWLGRLIDGNSDNVVMLVR